MKANKKDIFKKIIKRVSTDQAPADFTDMVMKTIEADVQRELALKALLKHEPTESPVFDFTANIMAQIHTNAQRSAYRPIITRKGWYGIAAIISVFLMLIGLVNTKTKAGTGISLTASALKHVSAVPPVFLMVLVGAGILLLVDYLVTQRGSSAGTV